MYYVPFSNTAVSCFSYSYFVYLHRQFYLQFPFSYILPSDYVSLPQFLDLNKAQLLLHLQTVMFLANRTRKKKKNLCSHSLVVDYETTMFRNNFQLYKISSAHVISPYLCLKAHLYSTTLFYFFHPNVKKRNLEKKNEETE